MDGLLSVPTAAWPPILMGHGASVPRIPAGPCLDTGPEAQAGKGGAELRGWTPRAPDLGADFCFPHP